MGTIRKRGSGYYAEVCVRRQRRGKTCRTKAAAEAWIKEQEQALVQGPAHTLADALDSYRRTYSSRKRTKVQEGKRLDRLQARLGGDRLLSELTPGRLAEWRDSELQRVSVASVLRDWNLLNHVLAVAVREWEWIPTNPLAKLKRPEPPAPRTRVLTDEEIERIVYCCGWPGETVSARVGAALLFALETAMRAGEIVALRPEHVRGDHVHVPLTKNGRPRDVPLSTRAREILAQVGNNFRLTSAQLDALFRKARTRACVPDVHFHDARRTALTRLSQHFNALELARISGHVDLKILLSTYYAPSVSDLAGKLS